MAEQYKASVFAGDGPFQLPVVGGRIKVALSSDPDKFLFEWALPAHDEKTKIVQLPISFGHAMQLKVLLQRWQKHLALPEPKGPP